MPQNYFVTGLPKSGKTTILEKIIEKLRERGLKVGGFLSPDKQEHGTRVAFYVQNIDNKRKRLLASVEGGGPKISKYHVKVKRFESVALPAMKRIEKYDVFVIDEIGRMEMRSKKFLDMLDEIFKSSVPVIASISQEYVDRYGIEGEVIMLTKMNREDVMFDLIEKTAGYRKRKKKKAKQKKKTTRKKTTRKKIPAKKRKKTREKAEKKPEQKKKRRGVLGKVREFLGF